MFPLAEEAKDHSIHIWSCMQAGERVRILRLEVAARDKDMITFVKALKLLLMAPA